MKCFTCKDEMKCIDDANDLGVRIDWYQCPRCNSKAEVNYGNGGEYIDKIIWERE